MAEMFVSVEAIFEKLKVKSVLINGVTIAAALFVSMSSADQKQVGEGLRISDLSQRPTISSTLGAEQSRQLKIAEYGQVADIQMSVVVYQEAVKIREAKANLPHHFLTGSTTQLDRYKFSPEYDVCLVNHLQNERILGCNPIIFHRRGKPKNPSLIE